MLLYARFFGFLYTEAQFQIAVCYLNGILSVEKSNTEAFKWFKKSAEQGHIEAQFQLAICYIKGI
ncbi:MAG: sel1 repeat family protein, partial [Moraxellaceae bacterium]|nr:sel1 repeat family protein [Moraxellaceae bacterium]